MTKKQAIEEFSRKQLAKQMKIDAKGLGIAPGAADAFIEKTLDAVEKGFKHKKIITEKDLTLAISRELKKYNKDFAYIYQNRATII